MKKMLVLLAVGMLALTSFGASNAPKGKCCAPCPPCPRGSATNKRVDERPRCGAGRLSKTFDSKTFRKPKLMSPNSLH